MTQKYRTIVIMCFIFFLTFQTVSLAFSPIDSLQPNRLNTILSNTHTSEKKVRVFITLNANPTTVTSRGKSTVQAAVISSQNVLISELRSKSIPFALHNRITNLLNGISGDLNERQISDVRRLPGVTSVRIVNKYIVRRAMSQKEMHANEITEQSSPVQGEGMIAAIIDTGIDYRHEAFDGDGRTKSVGIADLTDSTPFDQIALGYTSKVIGGYNWADRNNDIMDRNPNTEYHGTHVAGILAGQAVPAIKSQSSGVAPASKLLIEKVFSNDPLQQAAYGDDICAGIDHAVANHADVINLSLGTLNGSSNPDDPEYIAVMHAIQAGVTVVAAAGNEGMSSSQDDSSSSEFIQDNWNDQATVSSPAFFPGVIAVGASSDSRFEYPIRMAEFSSWGPSPELRVKPDISAPGLEIESTINYPNTAAYSGTSMASPNLAGVITLLKQVFISRGWSTASNDLLSSLSNTSKIILDQTNGSNQATPYLPHIQGAGLVQLKEALLSPCLLQTTDLESNQDWNASASLGSFSTREKAITLRIVNRGNEDETYQLGNDFVYREQLVADDPFQKRVKASVIPNATIDATGGWTNQQITVTANSSKTVHVIVQLPITFAEGHWVEGWIQLLHIPKGDQIQLPNLTLPYIGYFGSWSAIPIFDDTYDQTSTSKLSTISEKQLRLTYPPTIPSGMVSEDFEIGKPGFNTQNEFNAEHVSFSPNDDGIADTIAVQFELLRHVQALTVDILNQNGIVIDHINTNAGLSKQLLSNDALISDQWDGKVWNSSTGTRIDAPEGNYSFRLQAIPVLDRKATDDDWQVRILPFRLDRTALLVNKLPDVWNEQNASVSWDIPEPTSSIYSQQIQLDDGHWIDLTSDQRSYQWSNLAKNSHQITLRIADLARNMSTVTWDVVQSANRYLLYDNNNINIFDGVWQPTWDSPDEGTITITLFTQAQWQDQTGFTSQTTYSGTHHTASIHVTPEESIAEWVAKDALNNVIAKQVVNLNVQSIESTDVTGSTGLPLIWGDDMNVSVNPFLKPIPDGTKATVTWCPSSGNDLGCNTKTADPNSNGIFDPITFTASELNNYEGTLNVSLIDSNQNITGSLTQSIADIPKPKLTDWIGEQKKDVMTFYDDWYITMTSNELSLTPVTDAAIASLSWQVVDEKNKNTVVQSGQWIAASNDPIQIVLPSNESGEKIYYFTLTATDQQNRVIPNWKTYFFIANRPNHLIIPNSDTFAFDDHEHSQISWKINEHSNLFKDFDHIRVQVFQKNNDDTNKLLQETHIKDQTNWDGNFSELGLKDGDLVNITIDALDKNDSSIDQWVVHEIIDTGASIIWDKFGFPFPKSNLGTDTISVQGLTIVSHRLLSVTINDQKVTLPEPIKLNSSFYWDVNADIQLQEGNQQIRVQTTDDLGRKTTLVRSVYIDTTAPVITIDHKDNEITQNSILSLQVNVKDVSKSNETTGQAIRQILINGQERWSKDPAFETNDVKINLDVPLIPGKNIFHVIAIDDSLNKTETTITIFSDSQAPIITRTGFDPVNGFTSKNATLSATFSDDISPFDQLIIIQKVDDYIVPATSDSKLLSQTIQVSDLTEGQHTWSITATDESGRSTTSIKTFNVVYGFYSMHLQMTLGQAIGVTELRNEWLTASTSYADEWSKRVDRLRIFSWDSDVSNPTVFTMSNRCIGTTADALKLYFSKAESPVIECTIDHVPISFTHWKIADALESQTNEKSGFHAETNTIVPLGEQTSVWGTDQIPIILKPQHLLNESPPSAQAIENDWQLWVKHHVADWVEAWKNGVITPETDTDGNGTLTNEDLSIWLATWRP